MPYLQALLPCLLQLRERHTFELRVIGANMAPTSGLEVTSLAWSAETEVADLRPLDVGLMPLPDDEWARGKCGMKALQYMALAIPPVVSPVGVNRNIVRDGVNGFHASSEAEWIEKVGLLLSNSGLRRRLGEAGRRAVEVGFSAERWAPKIADLLREAAPCARDAHSP